MDKELKQAKEQYNHLFTRDIELEIKNYVLKTINDEKKNGRTHQLLEKFKPTKRNISRKLVFFSGAAIIIFAIVLTMGFVSPTMAKVVSKIPYFGKIFISKPLITMISEKLKENGYKTDAISVVYQPKKEIVISIVGSNKYYEDVKVEVEKNVQDILQKNNYDAFSVKIEKARKIENFISEDDQKRMKNEDRINTAIQNELQKYHLNVLSTSINSDNGNPYIKMEIPNTTSDSKIEELKSTIKRVIKLTKSDSYTLWVKKVDMIKREQDGRWGQNLSLIGESLISKREYKVKGLGYSVYPDIELVIRTTVKSTDEDAKEFGNNLAQVIEKFLKSEEMKSKVKDDVYQIKILSKDKKKLNVK